MIDQLDCEPPDEPPSECLASVPSTPWNDWRWQLRNRLLSLSDFERLNLSDAERAALSLETGRMPAAVTPYYADLLMKSEPLRRTMLPSLAELHSHACGLGDPLGEEHDSPVPGLVHRYPDRALFLVTDYCAAYCRYCTRSRRVGRPESKTNRQSTWEAGLDYIRATPEIRDVIVSGGDPLTLTDAALEHLLTRLRAIPHVEMIRIGTKTPMVLPQRITPALVRLLKRFHPLYVSVHCTHPDELTPESAQAFNRLADAGIPLGSQTVLLKGVNDDPDTLKRLYHGLLKVRVRPYYLYQCDQVQGAAHFRTPLETGLDIIRSLRGHTSGYAIPQFVVDLPGGGGKVPLCPDYILKRNGSEVTFTNYEGREFLAHDPIAQPLTLLTAPALETVPCA